MTLFHLIWGAIFATVMALFVSGTYLGRKHHKDVEAYVAQNHCTLVGVDTSNPRWPIAEYDCGGRRVRDSEIR